LPFTYGFPEMMENFPESVFESDFVLPEYHQIYRDTVARIRRGDERAECDIKSKDGTGTVHWYRLLLNRLEKDSPIVVGSARFIDLEKELKAQINAERTKIYTGDKSLLGYVITNLSTNRILEHREFSEDCPVTESGLPFDEAIRCSQISLVNEQDRKVYMEFHNREKILRDYNNGITTHTVEFQYRVPNGKIMWLKNMGNVLCEPNTGDLFLYEYCYDVNAKRMLEEVMVTAVNLSFERFASINYISRQANMIYNNQERESMSVEIKDYYEVSTEYGRNVVLPEDSEMFLHKISLEEIRRNLMENHSYEFTHRVKEPDGMIHTKRNRFIAYDDNQTVLMIRVDVTTLVKEEEEKRNVLSKALETAENATKVKSDFLARMSHDLRTPMNVIIGLSALTLDEAKNSAMVRDNMTKMRTVSDYMLDLVNDILNVSKLEEGTLRLNKQPYAYHDFILILQTMYAALCKEKGVELRFQEPKRNPVVMADKARLNQIMFNLFTNALKYTPPGGVIEFSVKNSSVKGKKLYCDYEIRDTGIGMSEEFQERMFEPFVQEDNSVTAELQGSGLGLAITKNLVELMDGTITIESQKDKGTAVTLHMKFDLVSLDGEEHQKMQIQEMEKNTLEGRNVLLVEDHPLNAQGALSCRVSWRLIAIWESQRKKSVWRGMIAMRQPIPSSHI